MSKANPKRDGSPRSCEWVGQTKAFEHFALYQGRTQSQEHIKPLHWYVTCRLVLEGGFHPNELKPRPPFSVTKRKNQHLIQFDPKSATGGEATVLGGLKTKSVDVVVNKNGIGPVLAVSCKGMTGAFRNLTNRMEETSGECTNLHITYPALVFGYLFLIRANRVYRPPDLENSSHGEEQVREIAPNDIAISKDGDPVETIMRFHSALGALTGRKGIRNDISRYEAISLVMIDTRNENTGQMLLDFPPLESPLRLEEFFENLYLRYDERYVYSAPDLKSKTSRMEWSPDSPILQSLPNSNLGYQVRLAND